MAYKVNRVAPAPVFRQKLLVRIVNWSLQRQKLEATQSRRDENIEAAKKQLNSAIPSNQG